MFYETAKNDHGLPHNPFKAIVAPRPIGWIGSLDAEGRPNLAPYSFFNAVCDTPPIVLFSSTAWKDSVANIEATGDFTCSLATYDLKDAMNRSSGAFAHGVSEFEEAGLEAAPSRLVRAPHVAGAKAVLECRHLQTIHPATVDGGEAECWIVLGQVVGIHIADEAIVDGQFDITRVRTIARLGYKDYTSVDSVFQMTRPKGG